MKKLLVTDFHIEESAIEELELTFDEILSYDADESIMIGDFFHKKKPTPREIIFGTKIAKLMLQKYKKVVFLRGNHDKTEDISAIDYLQYLGIQIVDYYIDEVNNLFGHFFTNKSKYEYGTYAKTISELKKYNYVVLGHQHSFQKLTPKIYHLGSVRYVHFNEVEDKCKYIAILEDDLEFIKLKSPIPMKDVNSINELKSIDQNTKVRLVIKNFEQFKKEINFLEEWKKKFFEFKIKLDFQRETIKSEIKENNKQKDLQSIINTFLDKIEDEEVKQELILEFKKENL